MPFLISSYYFPFFDNNETIFFSFLKLFHHTKNDHRTLKKNRTIFNSICFWWNIKIFKRNSTISIEFQRKNRLNPKCGCVWVWLRCGKLRWNVETLHAARRVSGEGTLDSVIKLVMFELKSRTAYLYVSLHFTRGREFETNIRMGNSGECAKHARIIYPLSIFFFWLSSSSEWLAGRHILIHWKDFLSTNHNIHNHLCAVNDEAGAYFNNIVGTFDWVVHLWQIILQTISIYY